MKPKPTILPPPLKKGDLIGVAAPAGPFDPERFKSGLNRLESLGFGTFCPDEIFFQDAYLAGSDESRAATLNSLLADDVIKAVFCARGGYGSMRLLNRLDFSAIASNPKIIIGFSDITALLLAIAGETGLTVFHGPVVTSLTEADEETVAHLENLLTGRNPFPVSLDEARIWSDGRAEGPLLGGNLTLLVHLLSTPWRPDFRDALLFLEDVGEAPYRLDRLLTTLKLSGVLDECSGLIIGRCEDCGTAGEILSVLDRTLADFSGPVVLDFPIGHGTRNLALPIGPRAVLDTAKGRLDLTEPYLG